MDKSAKPLLAHCLKHVINIIKRKRKHPAWLCICGCVVPKKNAPLSGAPNYNYGVHVHCPKCNRVVAQFVDPKETK